MKKVIINKIEKTISATFNVMSCGGLQSKSFVVINDENVEEKAKKLFPEALGKINLSTMQVTFLFDLEGEICSVVKSWMEPMKKIGDTISVFVEEDCIPL